MVSEKNNSKVDDQKKSAAETRENVETKPPGIALILPGAVAKGAYEAGVISVLAERGIKFDRVIGTSSGALNAVAFASGIRVGEEKEVSKKLVDAWIKLGSWRDTFNFNMRALFTGKGLSDQEGLFKMLRELVPPAGDKGINDFELRIIIASLDGITGKIGKTSATTYEKVLEFSAKDFDDQKSLEKVFVATTAACSFPILFRPSSIEGLGRCFDGGVVNNTPIQYALEDGDINHIILPVPFPIMVPAPHCQHGIDLLNHSIEILINERLYRDLKNAEDLNEKVKKLNSLVADGKLREDQLAEIKEILPYRTVKITQIRPQKPIGGGVLSGFFNQKLRESFIEEGKRAAIETLEGVTF